MAWSSSAVFAYMPYIGLKGTSFNLGSDTIMVALFNNSVSPDRTVNTAALTQYAGVGSTFSTANEQYYLTAWPQGGEVLASQTYSQSSNVDTFTAANTNSGAGCTLANVYGCLVYDSTISSDGLSFNYFGGSQSVSAGVFSVIWNASGIFAIST